MEKEKEKEKEKANAKEEEGPKERSDAVEAMGHDWSAGASFI